MGNGALLIDNITNGMRVEFSRARIDDDQP